MDYWWIFFLLMILGLGGCIGSFMNAVIYRLPRGIPLGKPLWSFCPRCQRSIQWRDNIPVWSYFRLKGRCRFCRGPISTRYVVIEVITLLAFLILFDTFFVAHLRNGITSASFSVSYQFYTDWPIYLAHAVLFACLIGMSTIDLQAYWVDIRFTHLAAVIGFILHAVWCTSPISSWPRPSPSFAGAASVAMLGAIVVHVVATWYWSRLPDSGQQDITTVEGTSSESPGPVPDPARTFPFTAWLAGLLLYYTLATLIVALMHRSDLTPTINQIPPSKQSFTPPGAAYAWRALPGLAFIFLAIIASGVKPRAADQEIEETLEAERPGARRVAWLELACLLLPVLLFVVTYLLVRNHGPLEEAWRSVWHARVGGRYPMIGIGTAASGYIIAAAIGWAVRISFTLILGKEAFGTGDIHIMAAAGAVAGWDVVAVGFLLSAILALIGWTVTLPFKRRHALPMGPWLTLAIFIMIILREPVIRGYLGPPLQFIVRHYFGGQP